MYYFKLGHFNINRKQIEILKFETTNVSLLRNPEQIGNTLIKTLVFGILRWLIGRPRSGSSNHSYLNGNMSIQITKNQNGDG